MHNKKQITMEAIKDQLLARQLRKPEGAEGIQLAQVMNTTNKWLCDQTARLLGMNEHDRLLEIGFGNGRLFDGLLLNSAGLKVDGVELSKTMLMEAIENNIQHIRNGRLSLYYGNSNRLPFEDNRYDKVLAINVAYFWDNPAEHLCEIHRVLKPGGQFAITVRTPESMMSLPAAQYGFQLLSAAEWVEEFHSRHFTDIISVHLQEPSLRQGEKGLTSFCIIGKKCHA